MNTNKRRRIVAGTMVALAMALVIPASANADLTVDDPADAAEDGDCTGIGANGSCTLRDAIGLANAFTGTHDLIDFAPGVDSITLTMGQLAITHPALTIDGPGANLLTVSGNSNSRIFIAQSVGQQLTIRDLTLADADTGADGGAILAESNDITIEGSVLIGNDADEGGAIYADDTDLILRRSLLTGNTAITAGGAIKGQAARVTVENSTISGNQATNGFSGSGGGVSLQNNFPNDIATFRDSTITNNTADGGGGISASEGGMPPPDPALINSIVANNTAPFPGVDLQGDFSASFSLIEVGTVSATVPGSNILGQDPQLGGLVINGGPSATRKPAAGSPVVDAGATSATTDQRGRPRPFDAAHIANSSSPGADGADMGAVELTSPETGAKRCGGKTATIVGAGRKVNGTNGADVIVGTNARNVIKGKGGKDVICGLGGPDRLIGGGARDTLIGGGGGDTLRGGPGRDKLKGGPGRDTQIQ